MTARVLVTGASGNVGAPLVSRLSAAGEQVVAAVHGSPAGSDAVRFDFTDRSTWAPALEGVDRVFLLRPPALSDVKTYIRPFIIELRDRDVKHVVFLSVMGVNRFMPHWQVEQDLTGSALGWTFLRPSFFMQNLTGAYRNEIRDRDRIIQPAGRGRFSFVDAADLAEAAAIVLSDTAVYGHSVLTFTGSEAFGYANVAAKLSATLGRPITYQPGRLLAARRQLIADGADHGYANVQLVINLTARLGMAKRTTADLAHILGRPPTCLDTFITENQNSWTPTPSAISGTTTAPDT